MNFWKEKVPRISEVLISDDFFLVLLPIFTGVIKAKGLTAIGPDARDVKQKKEVDKIQLPMIWNKKNEVHYSHFKSEPPLA